MVEEINDSEAPCETMNKTAKESGKQVFGQKKKRVSFKRGIKKDATRLNIKVHPP